MLSLEANHMIGQTIAHYKILEKLGEGGMGVVYKAEDIRLKRLVALKFLPPHLKGTEEEQSRFQQEAQSAATLNHPNICTIHAIAEHEGRNFIDMEYIDGETLRTKLPATTISQAVAYATQIGEALHEAHSHGIVHRDIKADNIMVNTKGQIKVMDFGLAKLKGSLKLTKASSTVGTIAYMAPEQIQGDEVDARADIFSFGILLFEMLTGKLPFRGEHEAAAMYSILNEEPESVHKYREDAPPELDRIIKRALEKDPADRYQHADDMVSELRRTQKQTTPFARPSAVVQPAGPPQTPSRRKRTLWITTGGIAVIVTLAILFVVRDTRRSPVETTHSRKMLVVMPFENLGSPEQEYFADGITEEITSKLSGLQGLGVIARSSAMQYKKTSKSIRQIGDELGVDYVLQGTIRWEHDNETQRVRVTPQLINVADGTQMWSHASEAVLSSAFQIQSDVAAQVASALNITLLQSEKKSLEAQVTDNADAYDAYLRGSEYMYRAIGEREYRIAEQLLQKAVDLDPEFLAAYAKLAELHSHIYWEQYDHSEGRALKSKTAAERSLQLDPNAPEAHAAMGWYHYHCQREYDLAEKEFTSALEMQPNNTNFLLGIASINRRRGRWDDALAQFKKIAENDPRTPTTMSDLGFTYSLMRQYAEAQQYYDRAIALAPEVAESYYSKALVRLLWKGDVRSARATLDEALRQKVGQDDPAFTYYSFFVDITGKKYEEALRHLESAPFPVLDFQEWRYPKSLLLGQVYGYLNTPEEARSMYDAARTTLEHELQQRPDDSRLHSSLGIAYAGLGRKEAAINEGRRGAELLPISLDAAVGPERVRELAQIYTMLGEEDAAVDQLEKLLSAASLTSVALVKIDPTWNPLHGNARFQKLIAGT